MDEGDKVKGGTVFWGLDIPEQFKRVFKGVVISNQGDVYIEWKEPKEVGLWAEGLGGLFMHSIASKAIRVDASELPPPMEVAVKQPVGSREVCIHCGIRPTGHVAVMLCPGEVAVKQPVGPVSKEKFESLTPRSRGMLVYLRGSDWREPNIPNEDNPYPPQSRGFEEWAQGRALGVQAAQDSEE